MFDKKTVNNWKRDYLSGMSYEKIGAKYGVPFQTVHRILQKHGVKSRSTASHGKNNYFWKGGIHIEKKEGYTSYCLVYAPDHPYKNKQNKVHGHRS